MNINSIPFDQSEPTNETIWLITPQQFESLEDGTVLHTITGKVLLKGAQIARETRHGFLPFGFLDEDKPRDMQFDEGSEW